MPHPPFLSPLLLCPHPSLHPSPTSSQTAESCKLWGLCVDQLFSTGESSSWDLPDCGLPRGARLSALPQKNLNYHITLEVWSAKPDPSEKALYVRTEVHLPCSLISVSPNTPWGLSPALLTPGLPALHKHPSPEVPPLHSLHCRFSQKGGRLSANS